MFEKRMEEIFSIEKLSAYMGEDEAKDLNEKLITGKYIPDVLKRINIPKNGHETRPIAISSEKDKAVQRVLYEELNEFFDSMFSNRSYGYRPNKGTIRAIKRVKDYIKRKYFYVYRSDFDNFFETIDHNRLINLLDIYIDDKRIIRLIGQYLQNGLFERKYIDHTQGVHQGDVLSPLLSNIYLHQFDMYLEREGVEFVRFADDFVMFFKTAQNDETVEKIDAFVQTLGLSLEKEKSYFSDINRGFSFLGCYFEHREVLIDRDNFEKKLKEIRKLKKYGFEEALKKAKDKYEGLHRYYGSVLSSKWQLNVIKNAVIEVLEEILTEEFKEKKKKDFEKFRNFEIKDINIKRLIESAYEMYKSKRELIPKEKISRQKRKTVKNLIKSSVISIHEYGVSLGVSKNKITVKQKGKITKTFPKSQIKRVIINSKGVSISSAFIHMCVKNDISIEFIDYAYNPYALIVSMNMAYPKTAIKQLEILNSPKRIEFAREFVKSKLKNQRSYIRYLNKYHKNLKTETEQLNKTILKLQKARRVEELMGYEGSGANIYWNAIGKVLKEEGFKRITKGAKDKINSALNYGYALLYSRVKFALIKAGLGVNISFLHALDKKPVLVFDFIEEFRTFVVDRAVVFAFNKSDDIDVDNAGRLTKNAKRRIIEEVNERLSSFQLYNGKKLSLEEIIQQQAYALSRAINEDAKYKSFTARF